VNAPEGYRWERQGRRRLLLAEGFLAEEVPGAQAGKPAETARSRGEVRRVARPGGVVVVRRYRHGGLFGRVLGDLFLSPRRAIREVEALAALDRAGVPVVEPLFLEVIRSGPLLRMRLGTREVAGARSLLDLLAAADADVAERRRALASTARTVRGMHGAGYRHPDLHLANLLWDGQRACIVDMDGARPAGELSDDARWRDLLRLLRSAEKWRSRLRCARPDALRFLRAYAAGEERWERELPRRMRQHRRTLRRHRPFWSG
jgi:tRNA A-37 threonylcarbamoyl transferase component Bud32